MVYTSPAVRLPGHLLTAAQWNTDAVENIKFLHDRPHCSLQKSATQSLTSGVATVVSWNVEINDTDVMHDNVTNNSRITIKTSGIYLFVCTLEWASGTTGVRFCELLYNGAATSQLAHRIPTNSTAVPCAMTFTQVACVISVNDFFEIRASHTQGAALNLTTLCMFSAIMIG